MPRNFTGYRSSDFISLASRLALWIGLGVRFRSDLLALVDDSPKPAPRIKGKDSLVWSPEKVSKVLDWLIENGVIERIELSRGLYSYTVYIPAANASSDLYEDYLQYSGMTRFEHENLESKDFELVTATRPSFGFTGSKDLEKTILGTLNREAGEERNAPSYGVPHIRTKKQFEVLLADIKKDRKEKREAFRLTRRRKAAKG